MFSTEAIYRQSYLTIPRCVFCDESLSLEAMVLYSFLLDRTKLSERNRLQDEQGIFVFCTIEEAARVIRRGRKKTIAIFRELIDAQRISRVRLGCACANKYYVHLPSEVSSGNFMKYPPDTCEVSVRYPSNNEPINNDLSNKEEYSASPVLSQSEQLLMKAKLDIRYFSRKAAGESEEQLEKELEALLQKKTPVF